STSVASCPLLCLKAGASREQLQRLLSQSQNVEGQHCGHGQASSRSRCTDGLVGRASCAADVHTDCNPVRCRPDPSLRTSYRHMQRHSSSWLANCYAWVFVGSSWYFMALSMLEMLVQFGGNMYPVLSAEARVEKQRIPPRQTGAVFAVRSTSLISKRKQTV